MKKYILGFYESKTLYRNGVDYYDPGSDGFASKLKIDREPIVEVLEYNGRKVLRCHRMVSGASSLFDTVDFLHGKIEWASDYWDAQRKLGFNEEEYKNAEIVEQHSALYR